MNKSESLKTVGLIATLAAFGVGGAYLFYLSRKADPLFGRATIRSILVALILILVQIAGFILSR